MPRAEGLESRVLFSTSPLPAPLDVHPEDADAPAAVLVDASLDDVEQILQGISPDAHVLMYDSAGEDLDDLISRVTDLVHETGQRLDSLSILSHGRSGAFRLGDQWITQSSLANDIWGELGDALEDEGNIYLFSCNVAAGPTAGQGLLDELARATGADVFASDDVTGAGGDWDLEAASSGDEAELADGLDTPVSVDLLSDYNHSLADFSDAAFTGTQTFDDDSQSFTIAVAGAGTINFSYDGSTDTLQILGTSGIDATTTITITDDDGTADLNLGGVTLDGNADTLASNVQIQSLTLNQNLTADLSVQGSVGTLTATNLNANLGITGDLDSASVDSVMGGAALTAGNVVGTFSLTDGGAAIYDSTIDDGYAVQYGDGELLATESIDFESYDLGGLDGQDDWDWANVWNSGTGHGTIVDLAGDQRIEFFNDTTGGFIRDLALDADIYDVSWTWQASSASVKQAMGLLASNGSVQGGWGEFGVRVLFNGDGNIWLRGGSWVDTGIVYGTDEHDLRIVVDNANGSAGTWSFYHNGDLIASDLTKLGDIGEDSLDVFALRADGAGGQYLDDLVIKAYVGGTPPNSAPAVTDDTFNVDENADDGTSVGTVNGMDGDPGDTLSYAIIGGNDNGAFTIDVNTGEITVADGSQLDSETLSQYVLSVRVTDGGGLTDTASITIDLNDVNEFAPVAEDQSVIIDADAADGTVVATVTATDADATSNIVYSIVSGNEDGIFQIDSATGEITIADSSSMNFLANEEYSLVVAASHAGAQVNFTATLTDDADTNTPGQVIGGINGTQWNTYTDADGNVSATLLDENGNPTNITIDLGKETGELSQIIDWSLTGYVPHDLGDFFGEGSNGDDGDIYDTNVQSGIFVDDGPDSGISIGARISGLEPGTYQFYLTSRNTNNDGGLNGIDEYNLYAGTVSSDAGTTDYSGMATGEGLDNSDNLTTWVDGENYLVVEMTVAAGEDAVLVMDPLTADEYRGFLNTLQIYRSPATNESMYATVTIDSDEAPVVENNETIVVGYHDNRVIGRSQLQVTDADSRLDYVIAEGPEHGYLARNGVAMAVGDSFDDDDVQEGKIRYVHTGSDHSADSYTLEVLQNNSPDVLTLTQLVSIEDSLAEFSLDNDASATGGLSELTVSPLDLVGVNGDIDTTRPDSLYWDVGQSTLNESEYIEFSITSNEELAISYRQLSMQVHYAAMGRGGTLYLRSSQDGFASNIASALVKEGNSWEMDLLTFDLAALDAATATTFRLYATKEGSANLSLGGRLDVRQMDVTGNLHPETAGESAEVDGACSVTIDVIDNDSDTAGESLTLQSVYGVSHGSVTIQNNKLVYTAEIAYRGTDTITYVVSDGRNVTHQEITLSIDQLPVEPEPEPEPQPEPEITEPVTEEPAEQPAPTPNEPEPTNEPEAPSVPSEPDDAPTQTTPTSEDTGSGDDGGSGSDAGRSSPLDGQQDSIEDPMGQDGGGESPASGGSDGSGMEESLGDEGDGADSGEPTGSGRDGAAGSESGADGEVVGRDGGWDGEARSSNGESVRGRVNVGSVGSGRSGHGGHSGWRSTAGQATADMVAIGNPNWKLGKETISGSLITPRSSYQSVERGSGMWETIDQVQQAQQAGSETAEVTTRVTAGTVVGLSTAASIGYLVWSVKSGALLSSFVAALPSWRVFDPLPILEYHEARDSDKNGRKRRSGFLSFLKIVLLGR